MKQDQNTNPEKEKTGAEQIPVDQQQTDETPVQQSVMSRRLAAGRSAENPAEEEKLEAPSLTASSPVLRWLDNFWYHHKWTTIVVAFFLVVGTICVIQLVTRPSYDATVTMASPYYMSNTEREELSKLFASVCPGDINGDGEIRIDITDYQIYTTQEEIDSDVEAYTQMGDKFQINQGTNQNKLENFYSFIKTGESSLCIVSEEMFNKLRSDTTVAVMKPLSEIYGNEELPNGAFGQFQTSYDGGTANLTFTTYGAAVTYAVERETAKVITAEWDGTTWDDTIPMDETDRVNAQSGTYYLYSKTNDAKDAVAYFTEARLNEVITEQAKGSVTGYAYGVRVSDTDFYHYNTAAQCIPEDAVIFVLNPTVLGKNHKAEVYEKQIAFFRAIVDFEVVEEDT